MRVRCPGCDTRLRVTADEDDPRIDCPRCGERFRPSDIDEDDDPPPRKQRGKAGGKKAAKGNDSTKVLIGVAVAAAVALIVSGVIVVIVLATGSKPTGEVAGGNRGFSPPVELNRPVAPPNQAVRPFNQQPANPAVPPNVPTNRPNDPRAGVATAPGNNPRNGQQHWAAPPDPLDDLFREPIDVKPPMAKVAVMKLTDTAAPPEVPTFHALKVARQGANAPTPKAGKLTLDEVKAATVYIKVDAGELSGSGSGFYLGAENGAALVATNHHVIEAAAGRRAAGAGPKPKITCVFHSGVPDKEHESPARIVAVDPIADLAVLRLEAPPAKLPKPIDPWATPAKLTETMEVRICGFPFGEILATATRNPNISVGTGNISSLRLRKGGALEQVQINGALNPGNSGGPIVDKDGRLVGVAVARISPKLGSGLGFAVPVEELIALLEGKVLAVAFVPAGIDGGAARIKVVVPVMDPRGLVQKVFVRYWAGKGAKPVGVKDARIGWRPLDRAEQLDLLMVDTGTALAVAVGELRVPADTPEVLVQVASANVANQVAASPPTTYAVKVEDVANGSDARPFADLAANPDSAAGKTLVVRGKVLGPPDGQREREEMLVIDSTGKRAADKFRFLASREVAVQFDEVDPDHRLNDARLVCVVGKRGADGVVPVRVVRCDFLNEGGGVVRSIPEADTKDQLAAVNRDPAKFADRKVTFTATAAPMTGRTAADDTLLVFFPNLVRPRFLSFAADKGLALKVIESKLKVNGLYRVRMTATVKGKTEAGNVAPLTVSKIEILDPKDDSVMRVIE